MFSSVRGTNAGRENLRSRQFQIKLVAAAINNGYAMRIPVHLGAAVRRSTPANDICAFNIELTVTDVSTGPYGGEFGVDAVTAMSGNAGIRPRAIEDQTANIRSRVMGKRFGSSDARAKVMPANSNRHSMNGGSFVNAGRAEYAGTTSRFDVQNICVDSGAITRST
ncbi:hypothetical protein [Paraburkholderia rhynchosiae]|uniref:hypothetical protein n=1 Tax=Paraburkholderia rhynchosiae TaxID=487049 RepID=UPI0011AEFF50|nr:hypothetical protein [Paraburkholderia rhynchosiae]